MVKSCAAFGCTARYKKGIKFHQFPKDANLRKQWVNALKREKYNPSSTAVICGNHFEETDYMINDYGKKVLNKEAVPCIFDHKRIKRRQVEPLMIDCESINAACEEKKEGSIACNRQTNPLSIDARQISVGDEWIQSPLASDRSDSTYDKDNCQPISKVYLTEDVDTKNAYLSKTSNVQDDPLSEIITIHDDATESESETSDSLADPSIKATIGKDESKELLVNEESILHPNYNNPKSTSNKKVFNAYRYVGDLKNVDMSSPDHARRCLDMVLGCVDNQKRKIRSLHNLNRNLTKYVHSLEYEIQKILSKEVINQSGGTADAETGTS